MAFVRILKALTVFVILLHFMGVTQLVSSYSKDGSRFVSMMTMTEEENKKEKDTKEDDNTEETGLKTMQEYRLTNSFYAGQSLGHIRSSESVEHQHIPVSTTPPPNCLG